MDNTLDAENVEEQKELIEENQDAQSENIQEPDEAANAAEGMTNNGDTPEDREFIEEKAVDVADSDIVQ